MLGNAEMPLAILLWVAVAILGLGVLGVGFKFLASMHEAFTEWKQDRENEKQRLRFIDITTGKRK